MRWNDISIKLKLIHVLTTFESSNIIDQEDQVYLSDLSLKLKPISLELTKLIAQITPWLTTRNKFVHALMEYKTNTIEEELKAFVIEGEMMIRKLDYFVKKV